MSKILNEPTQDAKLQALIDYCKANPDVRYWQAIRNCSNYGFIFGSNCCNIPLSTDILEDTFYK